MAEVDKRVPAQTQQRYVRTDTKCTSSSSGFAAPTTTRGTQYMLSGDGQTDCTSTPVYETVVLNQSERDAAYQSCRGNINNQRSSVAATVPYQQFNDAEWQDKVNKNKDNKTFVESMKKMKCQEMGYPAGTAEWKKCVASLPN